MSSVARVAPSLEEVGISESEGFVLGDGDSLSERRERGVGGVVVGGLWRSCEGE